MTGLTTISKDVITFELKSPKAEVQKPHEVLSESERQQFLDAASHQGTREYALISLALRVDFQASGLASIC